jgi:hypothetical protein
MATYQDDPDTIELFAPHQRNIKKNNYEAFKLILGDIITSPVHSQPPT